MIGWTWGSTEGVAGAGEGLGGAGATGNGRVGGAGRGVVPLAAATGVLWLVALAAATGVLWLVVASGTGVL